MPAASKYKKVMKTKRTAQEREKERGKNIKTAIKKND